MLYDLIQGGFANFDLVAFVMDMLLSLPPFLLALSMHEAAHAYVAYRCGDPTAKMLGRMTINPLKHIDPVGFLMLFVVGLGWAKPVPVNPRNFRSYRADDLKVSLAGVAMNLILWIVGSLAMYIFVAAALKNLPESLRYFDYGFLPDAQSNYYYTNQDAFLYAYGMRDTLIAPVFGSMAGYVFEMIKTFAVINISLAAFNLLPVPPLDGYHVVNDLLLHKSLFAQDMAVNFGRAFLLLLVFTGWLSKGLSFVLGYVFDGLGSAAYALFQLL